VEGGEDGDEERGGGVKRWEEGRERGGRGERRKKERRIE
jgi:hypothetical protein